MEVTMKNKINAVKLGNSLLFAFLTLVFNLLLSILLYVLIWYWLLPNLGFFIPSLLPFLEATYENSVPTPHHFLNNVCSVITILPSAILACRLLKKRKKAFCQYDKCMLSYKAGLLDYWQNYGLSDAIVFSVATIALVLMYATSENLLTVVFRTPDGVSYISLFPLAFTLFKLTGAFFGGLILLIMLAFAALGGVFFAQKKWRADYFIGE